MKRRLNSYIKYHKRKLKVTSDSHRKRIKIYTAAKKRLCTAHHLGLNSAITFDWSDSASRRTLVNAVDHVAGDFDVVILHLLAKDKLDRG